MVNIENELFEDIVATAGPSLGLGCKLAPFMLVRLQSQTLQLILS